MAKFERFKLIQKLANFILSQGNDCPIAISGDEQSGKSTLSLQLGRWLNNDNFLDLEKNVGYSIHEAIEEIRDIAPGSIYILDEAIRAVWKREWWRPANRELVKLMRQVGEKRSVFFFNLPKFFELDTPIRDDRVAFWLHVIGKENVDPETKKPERFWAVLFEKNRHVHERDPWYLEEGFKKLKKSRSKTNIITQTTPIDRIIKEYMKIPNCTHYFTFPPLQDDYWAKYHELSSKRKTEDQEESKTEVSWRQKPSIALNNAILGMTNLKCRECGQFFGYTQQQIADVLGVYTQKQVAIRLKLAQNSPANTKEQKDDI